MSPLGWVWDVLCGTTFASATAAAQPQHAPRSAPSAPAPADKAPSGKSWREHEYQAPRLVAAAKVRARRRGSIAVRAAA